MAGTIKIRTSPQRMAVDIRVPLLVKDKNEKGNCMKVLLVDDHEMVD